MSRSRIVFTGRMWLSASAGLSDGHQHLQEPWTGKGSKGMQLPGDIRACVPAGGTRLLWPTLFRGQDEAHRDIAGTAEEERSKELA